MFFSLRALILTGVVTAFCLVLFNASLGDVNSYAKAYDSRIGFYAERIDTFARISSWKQRMLLRHVANSSIPTWIAENRRATDTILLPPKEYADQYMKADAVWTDPRIFTYMAGFQPVIAWADTSRRHLANAFIALEPRAITLARKGGSINLDSLMNEYQQAIVQRRTLGRGAQ
ncbi:MAG: hypothetical protein J5I53_09345 [Bradyrhizobiaceae bacterium]|nr:hypothetical protein [Bradyrhizobiaceae bacterium]